MRMTVLAKEMSQTAGTDSRFTTLVARERVDANAESLGRFTLINGERLKHSPAC